MLHSNFGLFAQKGFKVIRKAERKYMNGQYKRSLELLSKADKMSYGFCGNAWLESERDINLLRSKIYIARGEYQLARNSLDSLNWKYKDDNFNLVRIRTYQSEYGKDSLCNMIDASLENIYIECDEYDCYAIISLTNGKWMKLNATVCNLDFATMDDKKKAEAWVRWFKESENYKLIKEKG